MTEHCLLKLEMGEPTLGASSFSLVFESNRVG